MKFRKRKDQIQRKRYKQDETTSLLNRYLQDPTNTKDRQRSSYVWVTQTPYDRSSKISDLEAVKLEKTLIPSETKPIVPKVPTADHSHGKGARFSVFERELVSTSMNPIVKQKYLAGGVSPSGTGPIRSAEWIDILESGSKDISLSEFKVSLELVNQTHYFGFSSDISNGVAVCRGTKGVYGSRSTITKLRNRCIQTNRSRSVSKLLKISRQQVRRLGVKGSLTGCTKST
jgi:ribosomal protein S14